MTEPELKFSDVLAQKRTDLAAQRTVMAAARSMMAWVRTGLSLIGFGFTIYRFLESLTEEGIQLTMRPHGPRDIGLFLIGLGTVSVLLGSIDYLNTVKEARKDFGTSINYFPLVMGSLIALLGMFLFVTIILKIEIL